MPGSDQEVHRWTASTYFCYQGTDVVAGRIFEYSYWFEKGSGGKTQERHRPRQSLQQIPERTVSSACSSHRVLPGYLQRQQIFLRGKVSRTGFSRRFLLTLPFILGLQKALNPRHHLPTEELESSPVVKDLPVGTSFHGASFSRPGGRGQGLCKWDEHTSLQPSVI